MPTEARAIGMVSPFKFQASRHCQGGCGIRNPRRIRTGPRPFRPRPPIVAPIVRDHGWVAGDRPQDADLHLAHQIRAHVNGGVNTASTRANNAMEGCAHAEGVSMAEVMACTWALSRDCPAASTRWGRVGIPEFQEKNQKDRSKSPRPTTVKPVTAPALKRHLQAGIPGCPWPRRRCGSWRRWRFHADEAGQAGEKAAGDKGKGTNMVRNPSRNCRPASRNMVTCLN